jgi:predicted ATPase
MLSFHQRIHAIDEPQPVEVAANMLADEVDVLCFDEFQVTDIQDAVILPRVFEVLFLRNVVIIMTSNTAPPLLYSGGLNRHVHIPAFIAVLTDYCNVLRLGGASRKTAIDYRRHAEALDLKGASLGGDSDGYLCGADAEKSLLSRWSKLVSGCSPTPEDLQLPMGRRLHISKAAGDVCLATFEELCGTSRGEADFIVLASRFSTVLLSGVPAFASLEIADEVKRFVKLLDVLYDRRVHLVVAAATSIDELFSGIRGDVREGDIMWRTTLYSADGKAGMAPGAVGTLCEAIQATERAESRLREMRTRRYAEDCRIANLSRSGSASVLTSNV